MLRTCLNAVQGIFCDSLSNLDREYNELVRNPLQNYNASIELHEHGKNVFMTYKPERNGLASELDNPFGDDYYRKTERASIRDLDSFGNEIVEVPNSSRALDYRSSHVNLNKLFCSSRKPAPPLTEEELQAIQKSDSNHDALIATQIEKMRTGIQKLQEVTQKFNCSESYKRDIEFLVENVDKFAESSSI